MRGELDQQLAVLLLDPGQLHGERRARRMVPEVPPTPRRAGGCACPDARAAARRGAGGSGTAPSGDAPFRGTRAARPLRSPTRRPRPGWHGHRQARSWAAKLTRPGAGLEPRADRAGARSHSSSSGC